MPRGRQKRVSAGRRYTPTTSSRRSRDRNGPDDAACVTAVTAVDDVNNGAMNRRATSGAPTHPRWDVASPANWSASLLRQTIEDRGMKLPSGIKKSQLLRISSTTSTLDPTPGATTRRITSRLRRPVRCCHLLHRQLVQQPLWLHRGRPLAGALQLTAIEWRPWLDVDNAIFRLRQLRQQHMPRTGDHQPNLSCSTLAPRWSHFSTSYEHCKHRCRQSLRDWMTWTNDRSPRDNTTSNKTTHPRSQHLRQRSTRSNLSPKSPTRSRRPCRELSVPLEFRYARLIAASNRYQPQLLLPQEFRRSSYRQWRRCHPQCVQRFSTVTT